MPLLPTGGTFIMETDAYTGECSGSMLLTDANMTALNDSMIKTMIFTITDNKRCRTNQSPEQQCGSEEAAL